MGGFRMQRNTIIAVFFTAAALSSAVHAGSLADPVVTPEIIAEEASSSSSGTALVAALAVLMMVPALD